jgi:hypothetical protein
MEKVTVKFLNTVLGHKRDTYDFLKGQLNYDLPEFNSAGCSDEWLEGVLMNKYYAVLHDFRKTP